MEKPERSEHSFTREWRECHLADVVPNPWQAARVAEGFLQRHGKSGRNDTQLLNNRIYLSEVLLRRVKSDIDCKAEKVFRDKVGENKIHFHLETDEQLNYAIGKYLEVWVSDKEGSLQHEAQALQHSLFEPVYKRDFNDLEEDFALYLEKATHCTGGIESPQSRRTPCRAGGVNGFIPTLSPADKTTELC